MRQLYDRVVIPGHVYDEIVAAGKGQPGAKQIVEADWIETRQVMVSSLVDALIYELDRGEAEAIVLAHEIKADLILIDEHKGRRVASRFGLRFIGLLGVLVEAMKRGLVSRVKPLLDDLIKTSGFWVDRKLYEYVLKTVSE